jgi:hypothetical protein
MMMASPFMKGLLNGNFGTTIPIRINYIQPAIFKCISEYA